MTCGSGSVRPEDTLLLQNFPEMIHWGGSGGDASPAMLDSTADRERRRNAA